MIESTHLTEAVCGGMEVREARWQASKALNVPSTWRQDGGVATDCILTERGEIKRGVTSHALRR
jgi:hypothetical protein